MAVLEENIDSYSKESLKLLRIKSVIQMTGLSRSYIYSLAEQGLFPKSVRLVPGGTGVAWLQSEIEEWINTRINERDCGGTK